MQDLGCIFEAEAWGVMVYWGLSRCGVAGQGAQEELKDGIRLTWSLDLAWLQFSPSLNNLRYIVAPTPKRPITRSSSIYAAL